VFSSCDVFVDHYGMAGAFELNCPGTQIALIRCQRVTAMSLVRLLGFRTLLCGCVIGRYRELATSREVSYVEEKGSHCELHGHRRNHTIPEHLTAVVAAVAVSKAS
jgi:hypothetical protein